MWSNERDEVSYSKQTYAKTMRILQNLEKRAWPKIL